MDWGKDHTQGMADWWKIFMTNWAQLPILLGAEKIYKFLNV